MPPAFERSRTMKQEIKDLYDLWLKKTEGNAELHDELSAISFRGKELRDVSRKFLNRFRNLNISHSAPKIKRKRKSFSPAASLLAFRSNLACKNCASRFTFVTFRLKRKKFRCSFVMVFGVRGCMYILLLKWGFRSFVPRFAGLRSAESHRKPPGLRRLFLNFR